MDKDTWLLVQLEYETVLASSKDIDKLYAWVEEKHPCWRNGDDYKVVSISEYYIDLDK